MTKTPRQERQLAIMRYRSAQAQKKSLDIPSENAKGQSEMTPGYWEIRCWLTNPQAPDMRISEQVGTERLDAVGATFSVSRIIFGEFYRGSSPEHITFKNGVIEGHLEEGAIAPFPKHSQNVSGSYAKDSFSLKIQMPLGEGFFQVIEGRLVKAID
ncbi:MAG: hypothetical protein AAF291_17360 [Pseudomonadota bacterium]